MNLVKCPRCDLNYIPDSDKYCTVCLREMKGDEKKDEMELCSICNASPALPGRDVCLSCHKEMHSSNSTTDTDADDEPEDVEDKMSMNSVSTMDEIIPQIHEEIPEGEYGEIENELSLEKVIEDEQNEDDEDDPE